MNDPEPVTIAPEATAMEEAVCPIAKPSEARTTGTSPAFLGLLPASLAYCYEIFTIGGLVRQTHTLFLPV